MQSRETSTHGTHHLLLRTSNTNLAHFSVLAWRSHQQEPVLHPLTITILYTLAIFAANQALDDKEKEDIKEAGEKMKDRRVEGWEAVVDKHVGLVLDLNNMQEDGKMRLLYPELVRSVSPLADAVVRERKLAGALRPTDPSIHERVEDSAYFRAVERLESAIKEFVAHAKRTGWGNLTPEERVQQSLALENYYQRQEANNKPLRSKVFGFVG